MDIHAKGVIEHILKYPFSEGNIVELLHGGTETFDAIINSIDAAKKFICLQFYIFRNDETGRRIASLLKEKARKGIRVYILYDHFGSFSTPKAFWNELKAAGINIGASRPFKFSAPLEYVRRDHRKVIIIDGIRAFIGGFNIADEYSGFHFRRRGPWRDTGLFVEGPVVNQLFEEFRRAWRLWTGNPLYEESMRLQIYKDGYHCISIFASSIRGNKRFRKLLYYSIKNSKRSIYITVAYFVPGWRLVNSLINAVKRGVDVRIILPGISDVPAAYYAGRVFYMRLLKAGVRLYYYRDVVLHAKTYVFDNQWSIVGSANLDAQSLRWNDEGNIGVWSDEFGREMERLFYEDLARSEEIRLEEWLKRPWTEKIKERFFALFRKRL